MTNANKPANAAMNLTDALLPYADFAGADFSNLDCTGIDVRQALLNAGATVTAPPDAATATPF